MYSVSLKNNKKFLCDEHTTILQGAKNNGILLNHSCLSARCRSCVVKVTSGETKNLQEEFVLSTKEKNENYILSCNAIPASNIKLDIEDIGNITIFPKKIFPSKIDNIEYLKKDVIKVILRLPPSVAFNFNAGQYVNLIKNGIKRSYSLANYSENKLEFFIKKYEGGEMSRYWFEEAKENDLIRVEGPLGTFFVRESNFKNLIFIGTGTGVAPIKSILDHLNNNPKLVLGKNIWVVIGARYEKDLFWQPEYENLNINFIKALSRESKTKTAYSGYVQNAVLEKNIDLKDSQVYACGSSDMISSSKKIFTQNNLRENNFYSDAFVQTN